MHKTGQLKQIANAFAIWGSGNVNRWHTHPDPLLRNSQDTTAAHSWRVAMLVFILTADKLREPADSIRAVSMVFAGVLHDADEVFTGDLSYSFKRIYPGIAKAVGDAGREWSRRMGLPDSEGYPLVKLADRIDAWMWAAVHSPELVKGDAWVQMKATILEEAVDLDVLPAVQNLLDGAMERNWF